MSPNLAPLLTAIEQLRSLTDRVEEEHYRISFHGGAIEAAHAEAILNLWSAAKSGGLDPVVRVGGEPVGEADLSPEDLDIIAGNPWQVLLGKERLAERLALRVGEQTFVFFSVDALANWVTATDPLAQPAGMAADLARPTTIRVHGLKDSFGGPALWVVPLELSSPPLVPPSQLPSQEQVQAVIHAVGDRALRINPAAFAITWGAVESEPALPFLQLGARVLGTCLAQELRVSRVPNAIPLRDEIDVVLRGAKRTKVPLVAAGEIASPALMAKLVEAIEWVYLERPETRHKLVMDRLSIEAVEGNGLLGILSSHLDSALAQAKDSYGFVILERRDAYHKEMREVMKDLRGQADLYAGKVRDIVGGLTRDFLGVLILVGISLVAKFDPKHLTELLESDIVLLFLKFLSGYFVLSCVLQLATHGRDAYLATEESKSWLDVLAHYTSRTEIQDRFGNPIGARRRTLFVAMGAASVFYVVAALAIWNLPLVVKGLLG